MAILNNLQDFEGRIGNIVAYKRRDSNKTYLRIKGGVSKKRIKTDKAFQGTREVNKEWGGCAKAALMIRNLFQNHQAVADLAHSPQLPKQFKYAILHINPVKGPFFFLNSDIFSKDFNLTVKILLNP